MQTPTRYLVALPGTVCTRTRSRRNVAMTRKETQIHPQRARRSLSAPSRVLIALDDRHRIGHTASTRASHHQFLTCSAPPGCSGDFENGVRPASASRPRARRAGPSALRFPALMRRSVQGGDAEKLDFAPRRRCGRPHRGLARTSYRSLSSRSEGRVPGRYARVGLYWARVRR